MFGDDGGQKVPAAHTSSVGDVEPGGHQYPVLHAPVHPGLVDATLAPNAPALQLLQALAPPALNCPGKQMVVAGVRSLVPRGHANPAAHKPEHDALLIAALSPYRPEGHGVHTADGTNQQQTHKAQTKTERRGTERAARVITCRSMTQRHTLPHWALAPSICT